jgi:WhiB family redox-sensing transcriptional regulator
MLDGCSDSPALPGQTYQTEPTTQPVALSLITGAGQLLELSRPEGQADDQWQERALCAQTDPEAFFPEKGGSTREAKRICQGCEVRHECLEYALANDERFGIWGGLSERERRRLKRGIV